jgi:FkbM family methyltransferase
MLRLRSFVRRALRPRRSIKSVGMLDSDDIIWAYRLFLCREADQQFIEGFQKGVPDRRHLRDEFVGSPEFGAYLSSAGYVRSQITRCVDRSDKPFFVTDAFLPCLSDMLDRSYQSRASSWLVENLHSGDTFVDIGAGVGWFSTLAGQLVGGAGKVYAFEPHGMTFEALKRTVEAQDAISIISCIRSALGSRNSFVNIALPPIADGLGARTAPLGQSLERAPACTLDSFLIDRRIAVVKINTNGVEADILEGARKTLLAHRPYLILTGRVVKELSSILEALGYIEDANKGGGETELVVLSPSRDANLVESVGTRPESRPV